MCFVGREKEIKVIIKTLERDTNIVLLGKYGIGRTALMKHMANTSQGPWRFFHVDFSQTPKEVCNTLLTQLCPGYYHKNNGRYETYQKSRFQIAHLELPDKRKPILILDNIARLSSHKLQFLNYLATEKQFGFIAIVEQFLPEQDLLRLRVAISPAIRLNLNNLNMRNTQEFFHKYSQKYHLNLTSNRIKAVSEITNGYPLAMKEFVKKELLKKECTSDTGTKPHV